MWVAPFGGASVRLLIVTLFPGEEALVPVVAEVDSPPDNVAVTVYRSSPSAQTSTKELPASRDRDADTGPKGGRTDWKCSLCVLSFPAAAVMSYNFV